jgi:hypothetical protein
VKVVVQVNKEKIVNEIVKACVIEDTYKTYKNKLTKFKSKFDLEDHQNFKNPIVLSNIINELGVNKKEYKEIYSQCLIESGELACKYLEAYSSGIPGLKYGKELYNIATESLVDKPKYFINIISKQSNIQFSSSWFSDNQLKRIYKNHHKTLYKIINDKYYLNDYYNYCFIFKDFIGLNQKENLIDKIIEYRDIKLAKKVINQSKIDLPQYLKNKINSILVIEELC